jgi:hypothetical protein
MSLEILWVVSPEAVVGFINKSESSWDTWVSLLLPLLFGISVVLDKSELLLLVSSVSSWSLFSLKVVKI